MSFPFAAGGGIGPGVDGLPGSSFLPGLDSFSVGDIIPSNQNISSARNYGHTTFADVYFRDPVSSWTGIVLAGAVVLGVFMFARKG